MLFESRYKKNLKRFTFYIDEIVNQANEKYLTPDCYPYIQPALQHSIELSKGQIESWSASTDVQILAIKVLYNVSFNELCSGRMHIYRGILDPTKPCDKLQFIVEKCLDYYVKHGIATEEDVADQLSLLREKISYSG